MKVGGASFSFPRSMFKLPWGERGLEWIYTPIMHALHTYTQGSHSLSLILPSQTPSQVVVSSVTYKGGLFLRPVSVIFKERGSVKKGFGR